MGVASGGNAVRDGIVVSGPNDWHRDPKTGRPAPGLGPVATEKAFRVRSARAGRSVGDEGPKVAELRARANALTVAERELTEREAAFEAEKAEYEAWKLEQKSKRSGKKNKESDE